MAKKRKNPPKSDSTTTTASATAASEAAAAIAVSVAAAEAAEAAEAAAAAAVAAAEAKKQQEEQQQQQQKEIEKIKQEEEDRQMNGDDEDLEADGDEDDEEEEEEEIDLDEEDADPEEDGEEDQKEKDENTPTDNTESAIVVKTEASDQDQQQIKKDENAPTDDEDEEPVEKLLEPFTKDQLIEILKDAAENHSDVLENIRKLSDTDPVHRKIFVHGLGWDTNSESLTEVFKQYGEIEDCNAVCDKITGKSKGYAFILFKHRSGARKSLKEPQKKIGSRMTACQLASAGPVPTSQTSSHSHASVAAASAVNVSEYTQRKIYVSNVAADIDPQKLVSFFSKFGEIEEGPLGLDKQTGKPKGFALFVYKSVESAKKALEEPHKTFDGHVLHCQKAIDGPKPNKGHHNQYQQHSHGGSGGGRPSKFQRTDNSSFGGSHVSSGPGGGHLMAQSVPSMQYNQGPSQALNPVLGQALTALLASQGGGGLGLTNLLGTLGSGGPNIPGVPPMMNNGMPGGYGNQHVGGGYGGQPGMQGGYPHPQMGQGSAGRSQKGGHMGSYMGH